MTETPEELELRRRSIPGQLDLLRSDLAMLSIRVAAIEEKLDIHPAE